MKDYKALAIERIANHRELERGLSRGKSRGRAVNFNTDPSRAYGSGIDYREDAMDALDLKRKNTVSDGALAYAYTNGVNYQEVVRNNLKEERKLSREEWDARAKSVKNTADFAYNAALKPTGKAIAWTAGKAVKGIKAIGKAPVNGFNKLVDRSVAADMYEQLDPDAVFEEDVATGLGNIVGRQVTRGRNARRYHDLEKMAEAHNDHPKTRRYMTPEGMYSVISGHWAQRARVDPTEEDAVADVEASEDSTPDQNYGASDNGATSNGTQGTNHNFKGNSEVLLIGQDPVIFLGDGSSSLLENNDGSESAVEDPEITIDLEDEVARVVRGRNRQSNAKNYVYQTRPNDDSNLVEFRSGFYDKHLLLDEEMDGAERKAKAQETYPRGVDSAFVQRDRVAKLRVKNEEAEKADFKKDVSANYETTKDLNDAYMDAFIEYSILENEDLNESLVTEDGEGSNEPAEEDSVKNPPIILNRVVGNSEKNREKDFINRIDLDSIGTLVNKLE